MSRSCFALALVTLFAAVRPAYATCIDERIDGLPYTCCTADDGETTCALRPPPPPRSPELTCWISDDKGDDVECCEPVDHSSKPICGRPGWRHMRCEGPSDPRCFDWAGPGAWDHVRQNRWNHEVSLGLVSGVFAREPSATESSRSYVPGAGFDAKLRMLYRWEPRRGIDRLLAAFPMLIVGNEFGLEVRAGTFVSQGDGARRSGAYAAIHPLGLWSLGRWRAFGVLSVAPELGVRKVEGRPAELHWGVHLPLSVMLRRRLGLEVELGLAPERGYTAGVGVVVR